MVTSTRLAATPIVRPLRLGSWLIAGLSLVLLVASLVILLAAGAPAAYLTGNVAYDFAGVISYLPHIAAGLVLTLRVPRHPLGWLLLVSALAISLQSLAGRAILYTHVLHDDPTLLTEVLAVFGDALWAPGVALGLIGLLVLYPDGRPPNRWSRLVLWIAGTAAAAYFVVTMTARAPLYYLESVANPLGVLGDSDSFEIGQGVTFVTLFLICLPAGVAVLIGRWRGADGAERQQLKWLLWAALIQVIALVASIIGAELVEGPVEGGWTGALSDLGGIALPVAIVIAITRHGLYDIDRVISRTATYAAVVGLLGLAFLGLVTVAAAFLPSDDPLVVAMATLAVFALFDPLRRRVQRLVDRRFYRSRYDAERVVDQFTGTLQNRVDAELVVEGWVGVVEETMQPASMGVWMRETR